MTNNNQKQAALITGANSGLGFEAARQLAEAGYDTIVLACRSQSKADLAKEQLATATGRDPFETLVVDVADLESSRRAAAELIEGGQRFDSVLLNAGMVPNELQRTKDGFEMCFASSLVGHHIIANELLSADLINDGGVVVLVGSEAANDDLPKMMGMSVYDFVKGEASAFGSSPSEAMKNFARAQGDVDYDGNRWYSSTKAFSAWWSAAMARRYPNGVSFYTVSPGANMSTAAARHATGPFKVMVTVMRKVGRYIGMDQPIEKGAARYIDVLHGDGGPYINGTTYTSEPKKMTGPLAASTPAHLTDRERQGTALDVLDEITGIRTTA